MDIITDLTTRAVAYITVLQDIGNQDLTKVFTVAYDDENIPSYKYKETIKLSDQQKNTITDIIWTSESVATVDEKVALFFHFSECLMAWLDSHLEEIPYKTPYEWRNKIRHILYEKSNSKGDASRVGLVKALHYMPLQVVIAITYKNGISPLSDYKQRLYQVWLPKERTFKILDEAEETDNLSWWDKNADNQDISRRDLAIRLLKNESELRNCLIKAEATLPFETIFNDELDEIDKSRDVRFDAHKRSGTEPGTGNVNQDPLVRAEDMQLYGLAFSGGGIRSATFNLGILQKLAESEVLPRIDYLSTVSGGGYIGTWFASWIQRGGSVYKVADRLNHKKSGDPMAEEVRPIRWLRMFSNYLAPDAGIMSTDSWTMGMTWLRNTLINQIILFLGLLTVLSVLNAVFYFWSFIFKLNGEFSLKDIWYWAFTALILLPGAVMAGLGMRRYHDNKPSESKWWEKWNKNLPNWLLLWAFAASYFVSARFITNHKKNLDYVQDLKCLLPTFILGVISMLIVAYVGKYQKNLSRSSDTKKINPIIILSSVIATAVGVLLLAGAWYLLSCIKHLPDQCFTSHPYVLKCCKPAGLVEHPKDIKLSHFGLKLDYVFGIPLIIEVIACTVVLRMAIMGALFPDERREWWGRLGAIAHKYIFLWIVIVSAVLLLPYTMQYVADNINIIKLAGGWGVIIGAGVKLAYSSTDSSKQTGAMGKTINIFILIVPYIFMLGFLLLGAYAINFLNTICSGLENLWLKRSIDENFTFLLACIILFVVLGGITLLLGNQVGVNEFSLHHFYRNRLIRAYLGATRSRTSRDKTVNKFTNFDNADDIKLKDFQTAKSYYGPLPILNTAINSTQNQELDRQDRKAESFIFTPLYCGFDFSLTRSAATAVDEIYEYGYRPTKNYAYDDGPSIGTAMAISGAAINPNWGYHSSPATAFLLTLFNVRLGWWIGNPRKNTWKSSDPSFGLLYLVDDFIGSSDIDSRYVCLSDGGHFDNMGLYELIRRRCSYIILGDGEEDDDSSFEGLANAMRRCRIDFGVEIEFDEKDFQNMIPQDSKSDIVECTIMRGTIKYSGGFEGKLVYIKTRVTKGLTVDVRQYDMTHTDFPEQSTADQFFNEDQFESYRKLGYDAIEKTDLVGFDF